MDELFTARERGQWIVFPPDVTMPDLMKEAPSSSSISPFSIPFIGLHQPAIFSKQYIWACTHYLDRDINLLREYHFTPGEEKSPRMCMKEKWSHIISYINNVLYICALWRDIAIPLGGRWRPTTRVLTVSLKQTFNSSRFIPHHSLFW